MQYREMNPSWLERLSHLFPASVAIATAGLLFPHPAEAFTVDGTVETTAEGFRDGVLVAEDIHSGDGFLMSEAFLSVPGVHIPSSLGPPVGRAMLTGGSSSAAFFSTEAAGLFFDPNPPNLYDINGIAEWNATVTHTGTSPANYELQLSINSIALRLIDGVDGPTWSAGYSILVGVDGSIVWSSEASITGNMNAITLNSTGTPLNPLPVNLPSPGNPKPGEFIGYDFGSFGDNISLGVLSNQGDSVDVDIFVFSYISGVPDFETGAYSIIGDPTDPFGGNGVNAFIIPEPRTYALIFGAGMILLVLFKRRRAR